jgi:hypothetical protein
MLGFEKNHVGYVFRHDEGALARIGKFAAAAKTAGWPGDIRAGILPPKNELPACGGGMRRSFERMLDLNRPMQPPLVRPAPENSQVTAPRAFNGGRTLGRDGRLRVAPERETHQHQSPKARALFRPIEKDHSTVTGQASGYRVGSALWYTSQGSLVAAETATDINLISNTRGLI